MGGNLDVPGGGRRLQVSVQAPHRTSAAQVQIQPLGISSQHLGAFSPKHGALLSDCPAHTVIRAAWICSLLLHSICKGCSLGLQCCARPSFPSETHPHLTSREASVSPPLGWRIVRAGTRGLLFSPRVPGACPQKCWLGLGG